MPYVSRHIDWVSISFPTEMDYNAVFPTFDWRYIGSGMHGFQFKYQERSSGAIWQCSERPRGMVNHATLSGDTLAILRQDRGLQDHGLVQRLLHCGGVASRIDLTINVHEGRLTPRAIQRAVKTGSAKPRSAVSRFIEGKNGGIEGDTLYLGSPSSDRQLRVYNKAAELGIVDGSAWLRLELELRRLRADGALHAVATNGIDAAVSGHMGDFLEWGDLEYQQALGSESVPPVDIPRRDSNRRRWLLGQVSIALAKELALDPDFRGIFDKSVNAALDNLKTSR